MTEQDWKRIEKTMEFILAEQAKFEAKFEANLARQSAEADKRFKRSEKRMDRMERYADRMVRIGERRMAQAEARISVLEAVMADLARTQKEVMAALRRYAGDGRGRRGN